MHARDAGADERGAQGDVDRVRQLQCVVPLAVCRERRADGEHSQVVSRGGL